MEDHQQTSDNLSVFIEIIHNLIVCIFGRVAKLLILTYLPTMALCKPYCNWT